MRFVLEKIKGLVTIQRPSKAYRQDRISSSTHLAGWSPTMLRTFRAILRCRPHSSMEDAIKRPLRKRKFVSRKYWMHTFLDGRIPKVGKRQTGSMAVTARGRASVHQKMAISRTT